MHRRDLLSTDPHLGHCGYQQGNWNTERSQYQHFVILSLRGPVIPLPHLTVPLRQIVTALAVVGGFTTLPCFFFFFFFLQRFQKTIQPLNSWRVNNANSGTGAQECMEPERVETPFTVTLTDMDFTAMTWEVGSEA